MSSHSPLRSDDSPFDDVQMKNAPPTSHIVTVFSLCLKGNPTLEIAGTKHRSQVIVLSIQKVYPKHLHIPALGKVPFWLMAVSA